MKWHRIRAVVRRHLLVWPRNLDQVLEIFWWPVLELLMWGFFTIFLTANAANTTSLIKFLLCGVMFWSIVAQSQMHTSMIYMRDAWDRNLFNIFSSPINIWEYSLGGLIVSLIKFTVSLIILIILAQVLFAFNIFSLSWYFWPFLLSLMVFGWSSGLFITGLILRFGWKVSSFAWTIVSFFQPFVAVFYPLSTLPEWAQRIGYIFPVTYVFEGMRSVLKYGTMDINYLIISFVLNIFYMLLAILFYRWMFRIAMDKGLLIKFS